MSYQIVQAESYWDCIESMRGDDPHRGHLVDTLAELHRRPFHNPKLRTHGIGAARNGQKLFSSDVGGRASDRRVVWQVFNRMIVVLLYGTHEVQERARRMQVGYDEGARLVQVSEQSPDVAGEQPQSHGARRRQRAGKLFMAWTDDDLIAAGLPAPAVEHLRALNSVDEFFDLQSHLGDEYFGRAFRLIAAEPRPATAADVAPTDAPEADFPTEPAATEVETVRETPPEQSGEDGVGARSEPATAEDVTAEVAPAEVDAADVAPGAEVDHHTEAEEPEVTAADLELERLLNDERAGAAFTRIEPEFLADVIGRPIEDWMIFLHPDQRVAAARRYQGPARVRGAAGTGKTVVGLHRAAHLAARNRNAGGSGGDRLLAEFATVAPVLFTTYIKTLPPVFEELYRRMLGTRDGEVEFVNVDRLARQVCSKAGDRAFVNLTKVGRAFEEAFGQVVVADTPLHGRFTPQYLREEITNVIKGRAVESLDAYLQLARTGRQAPLGRLQRTQVWELMEHWDAHMARHGTIDFADVILRALGHARALTEPVYSAVIVDEAQDLTLAGLWFLRALVNAPDAENDRPDGLFILGDAAQRIYPGGFTLRQAGVEVRGRTTVLTQNYRNTSEIIGAAMAVAGDRRVEDLGEEFRRGEEAIATVRRGPRPLLVAAGGTDAQIDEICRRIAHLTAAGDGFGPGDAAVLVPFNTAANRLSAGIESRGLQVQPLDGYDGRQSDRVKVGTFHRAKGLEFKAVFLPNLDRFGHIRRGLSDDEAAEATDLALSQLFVAMTRARDTLVVLHDGPLHEAVATATDHFEQLRL